MTDGQDFEVAFPRHAELRAEAASSDTGRSYFEGLAQRIQQSSQAREYHRALEEKLSRLDPAAWVQLRRKCAPYVGSPHAVRAWEQLFSTLNEAEGYLFLLEQQYHPVHFLPETDHTTPDLVACGARPAVMEVKTLHRSDDHHAYMLGQTGARTVGERILLRDRSNELPAGLGAKLTSVLDTAEAQVRRIRPHTTIDRYIMVIVTVDDDPESPAILRHIDEGLVDIARRRESRDVRIVIRRPYRDFTVGSGSE
jgi:hypothetical protein